MDRQKYLRQARVMFIFGAALMAGCDFGDPDAPPVPEVGIVTLRAAPVTLTTELSGRTSAYEVSEVRPQVDGLILRRLFVEGAEVRAGQLLYEIDPASYRANLNQQEGALASARANMVAARLRAERNAKLLEVDAVSRQENDDAKAAFEQAKANVQQQEAAVAGARIQLERTRIEAPISGRINRSNFTAGALVRAGQAEALTTISRLDPIYVDLAQSSSELLALKQAIASGEMKGPPGGRARVRLIMEDGKFFAREGRLELSEVTVDPSTAMVVRRAVFANPQGLLLPGMYVRAVVNEGVMQRAILAPQQGVSRNVRGEATALIVNAEDKVEQRTLVAARTMGHHWLITSGLKHGERLIVEGMQNAYPGAQVKAVPVDLATSRAKTLPAQEKRRQ